VVGEGKKVEKHCYIAKFFFLHHELNVAKNKKKKKLRLKRQFCRVIQGAVKSLARPRRKQATNSAGLYRGCLYRGIDKSLARLRRKQGADMSLARLRRKQATNSAGLYRVLLSP